MSPRADDEDRRRLHALKVHQWLPTWDEVRFDRTQFRSRPPEDFYLFTLPAADLRALSGISRRSTEGGLPRSRDLGIQRHHDAERSHEIRDFVGHGFPWSTLSRQRRESGDFDDLKKPGWLPTAIVVNILERDDTRHGQSVHTRDLIGIHDGVESEADLLLPVNFDDSAWEVSGLPPIEVIDGQHRLWAFDDRRFARSFHLPVVAFHGLDISWQAYLFYTINIKPKKINASLAFDLYPLLRTEDWLDKFEGHPVYRETRAQEITEALWSYPQSPWRGRIDMLGGRGDRSVTQAAWIRSLLATFVKAYESTSVKIGGLFGAPLRAHQPVLGWSRPQQSAFIILLWQELSDAVAAAQDPWAISLRAEDASASSKSDAALSGRYSLLNTDQGVRGVLAITNDLTYARADELQLDELGSEEVSDGTAESSISSAIDILQKSPAGPFLRELAVSLASYDWRTSAAPGLTEAVRSGKARFRGGTGYRELRMDLLHHVVSDQGTVAAVAKEVADALKL